MKEKSQMLSYCTMVEGMPLKRISFLHLFFFFMSDKCPMMEKGEKERFM